MSRSAFLRVGIYMVIILVGNRPGRVLVGGGVWGCVSRLGVGICRGWHWSGSALARVGKYTHTKTKTRKEKKENGREQKLRSEVFSD